MRHSFLLVICTVLLLMVVSTALVGSGVTSAAYNLIETAGSAVTQRSTLNFVSGATVVDDPSNNRTNVTISGGGGSFYQTVQEAGTPLPQEPVLNFPSNMSCVDNAGNTSTDCTPSGGGGGTSVHHLTYVAAGANTGGGFSSSVNYSGASTTFLSAIPMGILSGFNSGGGQTLNLTVFLPSTWTGAVTVTLETVTSSNNTGHYSFTPGYACVTNGFDYGASASYTTGTPVVIVAPGGSGTGFYREPGAMTFTPSCSAGNTLLFQATKGAIDTYTDTVAVLFADVAYTY